jgi:hypothetical protein
MATFWNGNNGRTPPARRKRARSMSLPVEKREISWWNSSGGRVALGFSQAPGLESLPPQTRREPRMTSAAPFDPYESLLGLEAPRPAPAPPRRRAKRCARRSGAIPGRSARGSKRPDAATRHPPAAPSLRWPKTSSRATGSRTCCRFCWPPPAAPRTRTWRCATSSVSRARSLTAFPFTACSPGAPRWRVFSWNSSPSRSFWPIFS